MLIPSRSSKLSSSGSGASSVGGGVGFGGGGAVCAGLCSSAILRELRFE